MPKNQGGAAADPISSVKFRWNGDKLTIEMLNRASDRWEFRNEFVRAGGIETVLRLNALLRAPGALIRGDRWRDLYGITLSHDVKRFRTVLRQGFPDCLGPGVDVGHALILTRHGWGVEIPARYWLRPIPLRHSTGRVL